MRGIEEVLVFVLPVQLHQPGGQVLERGGRGERARHERAAPALRGNLAADDHLVAAGLEDGFDDGEVLAGADEIRRGAAAEEQPDRFDEDGFSGAGLAGQDVERRFKLDGHRFDDREIA